MIQPNNDFYGIINAKKLPREVSCIFIDKESKVVLDIYQTSLTNSFFSDLLHHHDS